MIRTILILKRSGENICSGSSEENNSWNDTLASGFISAAFNFTQMSFGAEINDIELGPYRVLFELAEDIIIAAFFEKSDSIINIREKLIQLKKLLYSDYRESLNKIVCSPDDFKDLEITIEKIISESSDLKINEELKSQYIQFLDGFRSNPEILDCDLISVSGVPLIKEWNKEFLDLCLRQMDAFWKSKRYSLDQIIISYEERHLILHKINDNLVLSALIRRNTPLGLATLLIEEAGSNIVELTNSKLKGTNI